jgi:hypothetical protein
MPDYYNPAGENYESRDSHQLSDIVSNERADAENSRDRNRGLIHDAFPPQGNVTPSHTGSQSQAPNADTTPAMEAESARNVAARRTVNSVRNRTNEIFSTRINKYK